MKIENIPLNPLIHVRRLRLPVFLLALLAFATSPLRAQQPCNVMIVPENETPCISDIGHSDYVIRACRENTACYAARCMMTFEQITYTWEVEGGVPSPSADGSECCVAWGDGSSGRVILKVELDDGIECSASILVLLNDKPTADFQSVPDKMIDVNNPLVKYIHVCAGDNVTLTDISTADGIPVASCYWEGPMGYSVNNTYSFIAPGAGFYNIKHRVFNECGCYDEEDIKLIVGDECSINFECVGTVCAGTVSNYSVSDIDCSDYIWSVEGGFLTSGQHTNNITVQWGEPERGYGVVYLDGTPCDCACLSRRGVKVPVISDNVPIDGPSVVCVDTRQLFSLPLWGSTEYTWTVTPSSCTVNLGTMPNTSVMEFHSPGTYTISVTYKCDFLLCGPFTVRKVVEVKERLSIINPSEHEVCKGVGVTFGTNASTASRWTVTKNGATVATSANPSVAFTYNFATAGAYTVSAENDGYCNKAEFIVQAKDAPPALPEEKIDGEHQVCPNSTYRYTATPTSGNYYIRWEWNDGTSTHIHNGDKANITFGSTLHNINVYQVDRRTGCISPATVFQITQFTPSPWPYSTDIKVCEGETFDLDLVENQLPHVLYEWTVTPDHKISIESDHLSPHISLLTNYSNPQAHTATVSLERRYCVTMSQTRTVTVRINELDVSINAPQHNCLTSSSTFTIAEETNRDNVDEANTYWEVMDNGVTINTVHGSVLNQNFTTAGTYTVWLHYVSQYGCHADVNCTVSVSPFPNISLHLENGWLKVEGLEDYPPGFYNIAWTPGGEVGSQILFNSAVTHYQCTVTIGGCSRTLTYPNTPPSPNCLYRSNKITVTPECYNKITVDEVPNSGMVPPYSLSILQNNLYQAGKTVSSLPTTMWVPAVGDYSVQIEWNDGGQCYESSRAGTVTGIVDFELSTDCQGHIIFDDLSTYISGTTPWRTIIVYREEQGVYIGYSSHYTHLNHCQLGPFSEGKYAVGVDYGNGCHAQTKIIQIHPIPVITGVDIASRMCEQTPFLFSATATGQELTYRWDFGDGSHNFGRELYHVYKYNAQGINSKTVTLTITNLNGCSTSCSTQVQVVQMPNSPDYAVQYPSDVPDCPGSPATLRLLSSNINSTFNWYPNVIGNTSIVGVCCAGNYRVVENMNFVGCRHEALGNSKYPNGPMAEIISNPSYCADDMVVLLGDVGNEYDYQWTISPLPATSTATNTPNLSFLASPGTTYIIGLTVSQNNPQCSDSDAENITVSNLLAPPDISFVGAPCLSQGPVKVRSDDNANLLWSNGELASTTEFFTDGDAWAWYYDPLTGCRSEKARLTIPSPPDFGGLLTGCYPVCEGLLESYNPAMELPVYSINVANGTPWEWDLLHIPCTSDVTSAFPPLMLSVPLPSPGDYGLSVTDYGEGCTADSPRLTINPVPCLVSPLEVFPLDVVVTSVKCKREGCSLWFEYKLHICNISFEAIWIENIVGSGSSNVRQFLSPWDCVDVFVNVPFTIPMPFLHTFLLYGSDGIVGWTSSLTDDLKECTEMNQCDITATLTLTTGAASSGAGAMATVGFSLQFPLSVTSILGLWSEPGQIIDPVYTLPTVTGSLMIDYGRLTQMVVDKEDLCVYVICCLDEQELCMTKICVTARELYNAYHGLIDPEMSGLSKSGSSRKDNNTEQPNHSFALNPNPATSEVTVVDATGTVPREGVADITVMSMLGVKVMHCENSAVFNVSALPVGAYLVRIVTYDGYVEYIKLVKK